MVNCDQCREWYHFVCVELNTWLEDNIKTGTCMIVFELQVANSPRVGTCGTCQYVTIACICTLCNDLYYVNSFTIFFIVLYTSYICGRGRRGPHE